MAKELKQTKPALRRHFEFGPFSLANFENFFDDFGPFARWRPELRRMPLTSINMPEINLYEENSDLVVKADIPGLAKDEIDITLEGQTLTIKGEKKKEEESKEKDYYRSERSFGTFSRQIELPYEVKPDNVVASFKDGVLEIRLPKTEEAKKNAFKVKVS